MPVRKFFRHGNSDRDVELILSRHPYFHLTQLASAPMPPPLAALPVCHSHHNVDLAGDAYVAGPTACICRVYGHIRQRSVKLEMMTAALHRNNYAVTLILLTV